MLLLTTFETTLHYVTYGIFRNEVNWSGFQQCINEYVNLIDCVGMLDFLRSNECNIKKGALRQKWKILTHNKSHQAYLSEVTDVDCTTSPLSHRWIDGLDIHASKMHLNFGNRKDASAEAKSCR